MNTQRPKIPPLNALRAFEAAARLGNFSGAASELYVTPGAIAQQVKTLEAWIGVRLFDRHAQGVSLTDLGRTVLPEFTGAFDQLGEAVQSLSRQATPHVVRIAALPSIAQYWLSPRLPKIRRSVPGIEISVTAMQSAPNMKREPFDLSVFFEERTEDQRTLMICRDEIFPICAPDIAARLADPADLARETLLHDSTWTGDWEHWLSAVAPDLSLDTNGPVFSLYSLAIEEAKNGAGVLIGHAPLVSHILAAGKLVAPFRNAIQLDRHLSIGTAPRMVPDSALDRVIATLASGDPRN